MDTLDDDFTTPNPDEISPRPVGIRYGLILALVTIGLSIVAQIFGGEPGNENFGLGILLGCLSFIIIIGVIAAGIKVHRDQELGGFISFGRAMTVTFWIGLIYTIIATAWQFIYTKLIDPTAHEQALEIQEDTLNQLRAQVEDGEVPEAYLSIAESATSLGTNPIALFIFSILIILFLGLFVSLFMKKDKPMA